MSIFIPREGITIFEPIIRPIDRKVSYDAHSGRAVHPLHALPRQKTDSKKKVSSRVGQSKPLRTFSSYDASACLRTLCSMSSISQSLAHRSR